MFKKGSESDIKEGDAMDSKEYVRVATSIMDDLIG
jgi:hypothetical protein